VDLPEVLEVEDMTTTGEKRVVRKQHPHSDYEAFDGVWNRSPPRAVCRRCHYQLQNAETSCRLGDFLHPTHDRSGSLIECVNAGKLLDWDEKHTELEPFIPKKMRRKAKRLGVRP
jgi:hypothetical protein